MQGLRGHEHLPAPARKKHMQGVRGCEHLPAPVRKEHMQGVRWGELLPAPAPEEQMQGVPRGGRRVNASRPGGARRRCSCADGDAIDAHILGPSYFFTSLVLGPEEVPVCVCVCVCV